MNSNPLQSTLNQLLKVSTLPSDEKDNSKSKSVYAQQIYLSESKGSAHQWSVFNISKYLSEVIELPQYSNIFKSYEINGLKFISMNSPQDIRNAVRGEIDNHLHLIKICSHSQQLLKLVLEREGVGMDLKPKGEEFWTCSSGTVRMAAWLRFYGNIPSDDTVSSVIRSGITARDLVDMDEKGVAKRFPDSDVLVKGLQALRSMLLKTSIANKLVEKPKEKDSDSEELELLVEKHDKDKEKEKGKKKRSTAMKSRRERQTIEIESSQDDVPVHNNNNNNNTKMMSPILEEPSLDTSDKEKDVDIDHDEEMKRKKKMSSKKHRTKNDRNKEKRTGGSREEMDNNHNEEIDMDDLPPLPKDLDLDKLSSTNDQKMKEAMKNLQSQPPSDALLRRYKEERKGFLKRISALNEAVEDGSKAIEELRGYSQKLREQNKERDRGSEELIRSLKSDRDLAVKELEKMVSLYRSHTMSEKRQLEKEVVGLLQDKARERDVIPMNTFEDSLDLDDLDDQNLSEDSDLDDNPRRSSSPKRYNNKQRQTNNEPVYVTAQKKQTKINTLMDSSNSILKTSIDTLVPKDSPLMQSVNRKTIHPQHTTTVSLVEKQLDLDLLPSSSNSDANLLDVLNHTCAVQKSVFKQLLSFYKVSTPLSTSIEDTQMILNHVSNQWVKLGTKMLADSRTLRVGHAENVSKEYLSALNGLRKCSIRAMESGSIVVESSEKDLLISIGMVFAFGLVKKILHQHKDHKEQNQLLFLLNQITYGELPVHELSRENFRDFLESNFNISMVWDRFDSLCQKIDRDQKKGFLTVHEVSESFKMFNGTSHKISPYQSQLLLLVLLAIASEEVSRSKQHSVTSAVIEIINNNPTKKSFQTFLQTKNTIIGRESELEEKILHQTQTQTRNRIIGDHFFVSDVLKELTDPIIDQLKEILYRFHSGELVADPSLNTYVKGLLHEPYGLAKTIEYIVSNHDQLCADISHTLRIYDNRDSLVQSFSTCLVAFMSFRLSANIYLWKSLQTADRDVITKIFDSTSIVTNIEDQLINVTKEEETLRILKKIQVTGITKYESFMSELLGVSVPAVDSQSQLFAKFNKYVIKQGGGGFLTFCQFECELVLDFIRNLTSGKPRNKSLRNEATKMNLDIIRSQVLNSTTSTNKAKETSESHIINVVDDEIHSQRLTQLSQYLDMLNVKAAKKKKFLQSLLSLWQSAKFSTGLLPDINGKKELIMSSAEILLRVRDIQNELLIDIQEKPNTKYTMLANKVSLLRRAISQKIVIDSDMSISTLLSEISAMENSLLTANADAMKIATRINHHLTKPGKIN